MVLEAGAAARQQKAREEGRLVNPDKTQEQKQMELAATGVKATDIQKLAGLAESGQVDQKTFQQFRETGQIPDSAKPLLEQAIVPNKFVSDQKTTASGLPPETLQAIEDIKKAQADLGKTFAEQTKANEGFKTDLATIKAAQEAAKLKLGEIQQGKEMFFQKVGMEPAGAQIFKTVSEVEKDSGKIVDFSNPEFEAAVRGAVQNGGDLRAVIEGFAIDKTQAQNEGLAPSNVTTSNIRPTTDSTTGAPTTTPAVTGVSTLDGGDPDFDPESLDPSYQIKNILGGEADKSLEQAIADFAGLDPSDTTSARFLMGMLQMQLGVINDPATDKYLAKLDEQARNAYTEGLQLAEKGIKEIDQAIDGTLGTATTYAGLLAKVQVDEKQFAIEGIEAEKKWAQTQYDVWKDEELDNNARLEGYMKAKLHQMGAQDSVAGLMLLSKTLHSANLRLQLQDGQYKYGMDKLNIEGRRAMSNYTNNISKIVMDEKSSRDQAKGKLDDRLLEIEGMRLASDKEKQSANLQAMTGFFDSVQKLKGDTAAAKQAQLEQQYKMFRDAKDDAYKLSGLAGTIYTVDQEGRLIDTGVQTFDAKKFQQTYWLDYEQHKSLANDRTFNQFMDAVDHGGDPMALALQYGLDPNKFAGVTSTEELKSIFAEEKAYSNFYTSMTDGIADSQNYQAYSSWLGAGGKIINGGIPGLDEYAIPEVKASMDQYVARITQVESTPVNYMKGQSTHRGYDIVYKGQDALSLTDGVVVSVQPDSATGGYGNQIRVQDAQGRIHSYSHLGAPGNPMFAVKVGQKIGAGDPLGRMGYSGHVEPPGPGGTHTHYSIVGINDLGLKVEKYYQIAKTEGIDAAKTRIGEETDSKQTQAILNMFNDRINTAQQLNLQGGELYWTDTSESVSLVQSEKDAQAARDLVLGSPSLQKAGIDEKRLKSWAATLQGDDPKMQFETMLKQSAPNISQEQIDILYNAVKTYL